MNAVISIHLENWIIGTVRRKDCDFVTSGAQRLPMNSWRNPLQTILAITQLSNQPQSRMLLFPHSNATLVEEVARSSTAARNPKWKRKGEKLWLTCRPKTLIWKEK